MEDNELIYKRMVFSGALNITLGIVFIVLGVVSGIMLLISGGKLLSGKSRIMI